MYLARIFLDVSRSRTYPRDEDGAGEGDGHLPPANVVLALVRREVDLVRAHDALHLWHIRKRVR